MTFALLIQSMVIGLSLGSIYILMALGLTLMFGMMHIINFAHGAVYMLGAFVIYYFFGQWGVPYVLSFFLAMLLLGAFGFVIERCIYRPIKGGIEPTLVALIAVTTFVQAMGYPVFGTLDKHVPTVFHGMYSILGVGISAERLSIIPVASVLVLGERSVHCEQSFVVTSNGCRSLAVQYRDAPLVAGKRRTRETSA